MISSIPQELYSNMALNTKEHSHDVRALLENGECLIVSFSNRLVMSTLFNLYANMFSTRAADHNTRPVTLVLEEAREILHGLDLERTLVYARESNCSVVMALQSMHQAYMVYGKDIADTIFENITRIHLLPSMTSRKGHFLYRVDDDEELYSFDPKFTKVVELYKAELEYQRLTEQFSSIQKGTTEVVIFNHYLFECTNRVTLINVQDLSIRQVLYPTKEQEGQLGYFTDLFDSTYGQDAMDLSEEERSMLFRIGR
jgi:hypothetical protein